MEKKGQENKRRKEYKKGRGGEKMKRKASERRKNKEGTKIRKGHQEES